MLNKLSILLPHKNRAMFAFKTIQMYRYFLEGTGFEYEIILADDDSYKSDRDSLHALAGQHIKFHAVTRQHTGSQAVIALNEMAEIATGNILLLGQAETCPANTMFLHYTQDRIRNGLYFVGACFALSPMATLKWLSKPAEIFEFQHKLQNENYHPRFGEWYQHSEHRNRQLHFNSLIMLEDFHKAGGMPKEFENSVGKEDVAFLENVKAKGIAVQSVDSMLAFHQNHYGGLYENGHDGFRRWEV